MLEHLKKNNISNKTLKKAIIETAKHRNTYEIINNKELVNDVIKFLSTDNSMLNQWKKYQKNYEYARNIEYSSLIESLKSIKEEYFNK